MKKNKIVMVMMVLILMVTAAFSMSGDGGQQPVKPEKKTEITQAQNEQADQGGQKSVQEIKQDAKAENSDQSDQNKSNSTVKDWFGFDTGMSEKEFQEHQEAYIQRWIGLRESLIGKKTWDEKTEKNISKRRREDALRRYQWRLNINAIPKFEKYGIKLDDFFAGYDGRGVEPYTYATTISQVVIHGVVTIGYDSLKHAGYYLKPIEILKGGFYYDKLPDIIPFNIWGELNDGQEYIVFLGINSNTKNLKNLKDIRLENIGLGIQVREKTKVYSGLYYIGEISEIKSKIREIDRVNDTQNFYNIKF